MIVVTTEYGIKLFQKKNKADKYVIITSTKQNYFHYNHTSCFWGELVLFHCYPVDIVQTTVSSVHSVLLEKDQAAVGIILLYLFAFSVCEHICTTNAISFKILLTGYRTLEYCQTIVI